MNMMNYYRKFAHDVLDKWGLENWSFQYNKRIKKTLGRCFHYRKLIEISYDYAQSADQKEVEDTILHEIAHALAGPEAGHGPIWKRWARELGAEDKQFASVQKAYSGKRAPKYVVHYKGKIVKTYVKKPSTKSVNNIKYMYLQGRKRETYGRLQLEQYDPQRHSF